MGVRDIRTLSFIPPRLLEREFGQHGCSFWEKANAIDRSPSSALLRTKSMSKERTFTEDTSTCVTCATCCSTWPTNSPWTAQRQKLTSCITVKIRYADFNTYTKQQRQIPYTANDNVLTATSSTFDQLFERRQLIRLIGVKFSGLSGSYQIDLFEDTIEQIELLKQMDHIRKRFGSGAVMRASGLWWVIIPR